MYSKNTRTELDEQIHIVLSIENKVFSQFCVYPSLLRSVLSSAVQDATHQTTGLPKHCWKVPKIP